MTGTTITGTANEDTLVFVAGANTVVFDSAIGTGALVSFGTGNDLATFNGAISAGSIYGGTGNDTLAFAGAVISGATIDQGTGTDSLFFGTASDVTGTTLTGSGADSFNLQGENTVVFGALATSASLVSFGVNADQATFSGAIGAASIYGGGGADTLHFTNASSLLQPGPRWCGR